MNVRVLENKLQGPSLFSGPTLQAALSDMPHNEAAPALLEIAENAEQKRRGLIKKVVVIGAICFIFFFGVRLPLLFSPLRHIFWLQIVGAILNVVPTALPLFFSWFFAPQKIWQTLQNAVAALLLCPQEPRFLPHLVDGLNAGKTAEWKTMLYPALTAALWDAKTDDLVLRLDGTRRDALRAFVAADFPAAPFARSKTQVSTHFDDATTDLTVAAMRTLVTVGDKKTVKVLKRIIRTERNTRNETVVRDAAREFLPVLTAKITENEEIFRRLRILASTETKKPYAVIEKYADTLPPESAPVLLAEYLMQQKQSATRSRIFAGIGLAVAVGMMALIYLVLGRIMEAGLVGILSATTSVLASFCTSILRYPIEERQARKVAYELAKRSGEDTRLLPILLYSLQTTVDDKQRQAVENAILHLLPLLRTGDTSLVPTDLRRAVRAWLTLPRGALTKAVKDRAVVALNALALLGDTTSLRQVLVVERYGGEAKRNDYLRQAAARCADALRARKPLA